MSSSLRNILVAAFAVALPLTLTLPGCGSDDGGGGSSSGGSGNVGNTGGVGATGGTGGTGNTTGICLLNNCNSDQECAGCSFNRTKCKTSENRCVACDPSSGLGCPPDQVCTSFGTCAPSNLTCPTDAQGNPTITCAQNSDCAACDPLHQICDQTQGKCVACTDTNTSQCSQSDICVDNKCAHKCPDSCTADNDCMRCEYTDGQNVGKKAKACYNHVCSECSDTYACPSGLVCQKGTCVKPCGLPGQTAGTCNTDADCGGCGDTSTTTPWKCKFPINGGLHGVCAAQATGCSDLGPGAVLPAPYDKVTNLCSSDANCAGVGIQYNVGEQIRDLIGGPELDIGIKKIKIQDANVNYPMKKCASIELVNNVKCGVCVPCKVDSDCSPIKLDTLVFDLFKGDPLAQIAGAFLLDLLFGKNEPALHFQCLNIAAGYGVCAPCSNPTKACGSTGGSGTGTCDHDVCTTGGPLKADCGSCATEVCKNDSFCCTTQWDQLCVDATKKYCPNGCGGGGTTTCDHTPCTSGKALSKSCNSCTDKICTADPYCCSTSWDSTCVSQAQSETACASACSGTGCAHSECSTGGPLTKACSACATAVCNADPYCCNTDWDTTCVNEAKVETACSCN